MGGESRRRNGLIEGHLTADDDDGGGGDYDGT
jgi:hypothetical protein